MICGSGEISFLFSIPKTGYQIGENMHVTADIRNMSKREIIYSEVAINQTITFKAGQFQGCRLNLKVAGCRLQVELEGCRLQVAGCKLQVEHEVQINAAT